LLLWDLPATQPPSKLLPPQPYGIRKLALSPNGKTLISGDGRGALLLWDLTKTPARTTFLPGHQGAAIQTLAFNPNGKTFVSGASRGVNLLWDVNDRSPRSTPFPGLNSSAGWTFNADGKALAAADDNGRIVVWNLRMMLSSVLTEVLSQ
jgi:WD40 repeat protein